jgi:hypothetical protein
MSAKQDDRLHMIDTLLRNDARVEVWGEKPSRSRRCPMRAHHSTLQVAYENDETAVPELLDIHLVSRLRSLLRSLKM